MRLKTLWDILKKTGSKWMDDDVPRLAAALAFYSLFSLAPMLIIVVYMAGLIFGEQAARGELIDQIRNTVGEQNAYLIQRTVTGAYNFRSGILATGAAVIAFLFGASSLFVELQNAMDTIWKVEQGTESGVKQFFKERLLAFIMLVGIGFLLTLSVFVSTVLSILYKYVGGHVGDLSEYLPIYRFGEFIFSFVLVTLLFAMIFKVLPSVRIKWEDVWIGAVITSFLFTLGKFLIGLYLGYNAAASPFGAAGSLVVFLFWIYYSAQVFFFGAELTQVYSNRASKKTAESHF